MKDMKMQAEGLIFLSSIFLSFSLYGFGLIWQIMRMEWLKVNCSVKCRTPGEIPFPGISQWTKTG